MLKTELPPSFDIADKNEFTYYMILRIVFYSLKGVFGD